ncbi:MAG: ABC transporter ATP-binding protein [Phycisphaerales bacterium]
MKTKAPPKALVATPDPAHERIAEQAARVEADFQTSKVVASRLFKRMMRYKKLQFAIIALALVVSVTYVATPWLIKETIRWTLEEPERLAAHTDLSPQEGAIVGAALIALVAIMFYVAMGVRMLCVNKLAEYVCYDLRADLFEHVQKLHMGFFDKTKVGRILSRGTTDVNAVRAAVSQVIPRTLIHVVEGGLLALLMLITDWMLALAVFAVGPFLWWANARFRRKLHTAYRTVQESHSRITANVAETVAGIRVTQAFAREDHNASLFRDLVRFHRANNMHAARVHGVYIPLFDITNFVVSAIIIAFGGYRVINGDIGYADLVGFLLYTGGFFVSIIVLAELYNTVLQAIAGGERLFALLDTQPQITDAPDAIELQRTNAGARIEFSNVTFGYDPDKPVLRDISFAVEPGKTLALVGHTGSGKTSIVSLIARLYAHQRGTITIDGRPIQSVTQHSLHRQTGLVLQDNFLFAGTLADNIRFARPDATDDDVREACARLDCLDIFESLPQGIHTEVGERGAHLSLGQRQLACFARAMCADPRILMLDEATSAVDTFTEHRIQIALERLMTGRTCVVVAHRLSTVRRAHTILVLDHGVIAERGTHNELLARDDGLYRSLYDQFVKLSSE